MGLTDCETEFVGPDSFNERVYEFEEVQRGSGYHGISQDVAEHGGKTGNAFGKAGNRQEAEG